MPTYNGHKNWNHWNVSLWLKNDYALYTAMLESIRYHKRRDIAARALLQKLLNNGKYLTPDGAPFSFTTIRAAMRGIET